MGSQKQFEGSFHIAGRKKIDATAKQIFGSFDSWGPARGLLWINLIPSIVISPGRGRQPR